MRIYVDIYFLQPFSAPSPRSKKETNKFFSSPRKFSSFAFYANQPSFRINFVLFPWKAHTHMITLDRQRSRTVPAILTKREAPKDKHFDWKKLNVKVCLFGFFFSFRAHLVDAKHKGLTDCPFNICLMAHVSEKKTKAKREKKTSESRCTATRPCGWSSIVFC